MLLFVLVIGVVRLQIIEGNIHSKLNYFETLKSVDVKSRERRSLDGREPIYKELSFYALGRGFSLSVKPDDSIFSPDFKSYVVKANDHAEPFHINRNEFYKGSMAGEEGVVDAHLEDSVWNIQVTTQDEVYSIEPSWRHLPANENHTLIAYRHSDIKWDNSFPDLHKQNGSRQKICEGIHAEDDMSEINYTQNNSTGDGRYKRQAWLVDRNSCSLILVADYKFNQAIGGGFKHRTSNNIIGRLQRIETIYRQTNWDPNRGHVGFGFQIKEVRIHEDATIVTPGERHYNMKGDPYSEVTWNTRSLLELFSSNHYFTRFCLAHLFTYQKFSGGVLGLAYIASSRLGAVGGVCSPPYRKTAGRWSVLNTGWSSAMNTAGNQQLAQESMLVTAHEFGHNWGSEHDSDTDECAPSSFKKGKYIMYPYAVSGWEENNFFFSPCSKRYVSDVIRAKAYKCFEEKKASTPYCGNSIVDKGEECDAGSDEGDACCDTNCRFKAGARCSPMNYECCLNCQMAPSTHECRITSELSCLESTNCNGSSFDCPFPEAKPRDTDCVDEGKCRDGRCLSFCEIMNKEPCICAEAVNACKRCCKPKGGTAEQCEVAGGNMVEGRPCYQGFCNKMGICEKQEAELIFRFFDFIEKLTPSRFVEIMRSNIVGTVIILSLIIWIPASWIFSCIDKRKESEDMDSYAWKMSPFLYAPEENPERRIRVSEIRRIGRTPQSRSRPMSASSISLQSYERESAV